MRISSYSIGRSLVRGVWSDSGGCGGKDEFVCISNRPSLAHLRSRLYLITVRDDDRSQMSPSPNEAQYLATTVDSIPFAMVQSVTTDTDRTAGAAAAAAASAAAAPDQAPNDVV
jgi:hypothetical protein